FRSRGLLCATATCMLSELSDVDRPIFLIGQLYPGSTLREWQESGQINLPLGPEATCVRKVSWQGRMLTVLAGSDDRGLMYALLDVARHVELAPSDTDSIVSLEESAEQPELAWRSLAMYLYNADVERDWYFSTDFWKTHFGMLARNRYNAFSLVFGSQTAYLTPPYPFMLKMEDFPEVKVPGLTDEERNLNLEMLRTISRLARARGLDFFLAIWQQHAHIYGESMVEGLGPENLQSYCAVGLKRLLEACPDIMGVQLRVNVESGIQPEDAPAFFRAIFGAVRDCGRPLRLDIRAKGITDDTIRAALDTGLDVTVSTKFWCEHLGLPSHQAEIQQADKLRRRYGYADLLRHPRSYAFLYRLWAVGSQRILLWGDPEYVTRFADSCHLGESRGFEVTSPLTGKGYGNAPGQWRIFADNRLEFYRHEYERYWYFYLIFGRLGYNPRTSQSVWRREFVARFGEAVAPFVQAAYHHASQVIPLITAAHLPSASTWRYWPEMETGGKLEDYVRIEPSDTGRFFSAEGYVRAYLDRKPSGKWPPHKVSARLRGIARSAREAMAEAKHRLSESVSAEFRSTELDVQVLSGLAEYHAAKLLAAEQLAFFNATGDCAALRRGIPLAQTAQAAWKGIVAVTDGAYYRDLRFGWQETSDGLGHFGHWKDRLTLVREDVAYLVETEAECVRDAAQGPPRIAHVQVRRAMPGRDLTIEATVAGEKPLTAVNLYYRASGQTRFERLPMTCTAAPVYTATLPGSSLTDILEYYVEAVSDKGTRVPFPAEALSQPIQVWIGSDDRPPDIQHIPVRSCRPGKPLRIRATVQSDSPLATVRLHYRELNHKMNYRILDMVEVDGAYQAEIPGKEITPEWDMIYAIEAVGVSGNGCFYPDIEVASPFVVVRVALPNQSQYGA
ncbi:MAG: hypothetical protein J7M27_10920, partial [Candidatus Latescibacteria bacterium]|nr:hypothetical protein [Candidatus Latescibacterota bacterium]